MDNMVLRIDQSGCGVVNKNHITGVMFGMTNINILEGLLFPFARTKCAGLQTAIQNIDQ